MQGNKTVEAYIKANMQWHDELVKLRKILNDTGLEETIKWGAPCYTYAGKNQVGLAAFKSYVGLWFFQGALLKDSQKVLINAQDGKTRAMRQWRFHSIKEIKVTPIKAYIKEAIGLAAAGKTIRAQRGKPVVMPPELKSALAKSKKAAAAYEKMTIGKQREYADYIADAKRPETRVKRLEKIIPMLIENRGLHDKYRNC